MKKILIVVDMQNDFIDGALGTAEAQSIVSNVVKKIKKYKNDTIYATRDTHRKNYLETQEGKNLPVVHCVKGTHGWKLNSDVEKALEKTNATIIDKKDSFGFPKLIKILSAENKKETCQIEIVGLCTDICVVTNALMIKGSLPEIEISVDSSCCAGVTPKKHKAAIETMRSCQIKII